MDIEKGIKERRSVRSYKPDPIPEEDLEKILDAGRWAPSAGNRQPLEMIIVKKDDIRKKLTEAAGGQSFIAEAPVDIVICANIPRTVKRYGDRGRNLYVIQDTAAATQNIHLMAKALGYSTCWIGAFDEERVAKVMETPDEVRPLAIIPIGKSDQQPKAPSRRNLEEMTHENTYSG